MPRDTMLTRIRAEYLEMPGLRLTVEQAQRLCGVERSVCKSVLDALVEEKFLCVKVNGAYARSTDGEMPRPYPAKADLRPRDAHDRRAHVSFALAKQ
jgi:hypothetical protein